MDGIKASSSSKVLDLRGLPTLADRLMWYLIYAIGVFGAGFIVAACVAAWAFSHPLPHGIVHSEIYGQR